MVKKNTGDEQSNKKWLLMAIIIILLLINAIQLYMQTQNRKQLEEQIVVIGNKDAEIKIYGYKLDSIQHELESRYAEIAKLGGDTATMGALIKQLTSQKRNLKADFDNISRKYNEIKDNYDELMAAKDKEIEDLRSERDIMYKENNVLKRKQVSLSDSISQLNYKKEELSKQVQQAAVLKAANIKVTFIRKDKEIDETEYKAKKVEKLKIAFDALENKVAKIESKTFYLRVVEPDGAALYDLSTGGGSFTVDGNNVYYTAKQDILYEQATKNIVFYYSKGSAYKPGKHLIEVYCEGKLIGRGGFTLK